MKQVKILLVIVTAVLALQGFCLSPAFPQPYRVVIDPAHGGDDGGATLSRSVHEKDITLRIARKIRDGLKGEKNITVILTRQDDVTVPLKQRKDVAEKEGADLFVSLHVNAGFGKEAKGYEVYVAGYEEPESKKSGANDKVIIKDMIERQSINDSIRFARVLQKNLRTVFPRQDRGIRTLPVLLLEGLDVPAVVAELGFSTNVENNRQLNDESVLDSLAEVLRLSVLEYFAEGA